FGASGAIKFLAMVFGTMFGIYLLYRLTVHYFGRSGVLARLLLQVPAIGPCMQALVLGRFCMALRLTTETAMPIADALTLSLRATDNEAFVACTDQVRSTV